MRFMSAQAITKMKQMCGGVLVVVLLVLSQMVWAQFEPDMPISSVPATVSPATGSTVPATVSPATGSTVPATVSPAIGSTVPATVSPAIGSTVPATVSPTIAGSVKNSTFNSTSGSTSRRVDGCPVLLLSLLLVGPVIYDWSL